MTSVKPHGRIPMEETDFSLREMQVLTMLSYGKSRGAIGDALGISIHTVRHYIDQLLRESHAHNTHELVALAFMDGVLV